MQDIVKASFVVFCWHSHTKTVQQVNTAILFLAKHSLCLRGSVAIYLSRERQSSSNMTTVSAKWIEDERINGGTGGERMRVRNCRQVKWNMLTSIHASNDPFITFEGSIPHDKLTLFTTYNHTINSSSVNAYMLHTRYSSHFSFSMLRSYIHSLSVQAPFCSSRLPLYPVLYLTRKGHSSWEVQQQLHRFTFAFLQSHEIYILVIFTQTCAWTFARYKGQLNPEFHLIAKREEDDRV